tara:strand:- start:1150 stop:1293 length:144 start_codon:yes stop_codon:yes gene_type:complete
MPTASTKPAVIRSNAGNTVIVDRVQSNPSLADLIKNKPKERSDDFAV